MSQLPINPLSPEEQQKIMEQMYLLMGKQVQSYHTKKPKLNAEKSAT